MGLLLSTASQRKRTLKGALQKRIQIPKNAHERNAACINSEAKVPASPAETAQAATKNIAKVGPHRGRIASATVPLRTFTRMAVD